MKGPPEMDGRTQEPAKVICYSPPMNRKPLTQGRIAAAIAFLAGRMASTGFLVGPCRRAVAGDHGPKR